MFKKGFFAFKWITTRGEILNLRRTGKLRRGKYIYVWALPHESGEGNSHPGISVTTGRGFKSAADRNLAKRRIVGCIMESRGLLDDRYSYLVEARPGVEKEKYHNLVIEIEGLLRNII